MYFSDDALTVVCVSRSLNLRATPQAVTKLKVSRLLQEITLVICSTSRAKAGNAMKIQQIQELATGTFVLGLTLAKIYGRSPSSA